MKKNGPAPIAIIAYNRPLHLRKTIEALLLNPEVVKSNLYVFSDAPKNQEAYPAVRDVRSYLKAISGFKSISIIERESNFGLARSVVSAVDHVLAEHERIIVLEDDLVTSRFFLQYMNEALDLYAEQPEVASIHGFFYEFGKSLPDSFFLRGTDCLGWATWRRAWKIYQPDGQSLLTQLENQKLTAAFDFDNSYPYTQMLKDQIAGKISSWAIRWHASAFLKQMVTLNPGVSHIIHIGNDGTGTNFGNESFLDTELAQKPTILTKLPPKESRLARRKLIKFYRKTFPRPGIIQKLKQRIKMLLK